MSLAADLQSNTKRVGHILVAEGLEFAWTNITELAGTSYLGEGRTILSGLEVPKSIKHACNIREGLLTDSAVSFTVLDNGHNAAGDVAKLFRAIHDESTIDRIFEEVGSDETTLTTKTGANASSVSLQGRHIGTEAISSSGGRRYRYIHPGDAPPPMHHAWSGGEFGGQGLPALEVSDLPIIFEGREIALHELIWDTTDEDWATWSEQHAAGSMIFHGTMRGRGEIVGNGKFKIECFGEASLTRRVLNRSRSSESFGVVPKLTLENEKRGILIAFQNQQTNGTANTVYDSCFFQEDQDISALTFDALKTELNALANAVEAGTASAVNYEGSTNFSNVNGSINFTTEGVTIKYNDSTEPAIRRGRAYIVMHKKYWAQLGFDPNVQGSLATTSPDYIRFKPFDPTVNLLGVDPLGYRDDTGVGYTLDFTGYWQCEITTDAPAGIDSELPPDNYGSPRLWRAIYPGGMTELDENGDQEISITCDPSVNIPSQLTLPPADLFPPDDRPSIDGTTVDSMGWFLFTGTIARASFQDGSQDFEDYAQVARCSWVANGAGIDYDSDGIWSAIRIEQWEDPRAFGLPYKKMTAPWLAGGTSEIRATPIGVFGMYRHWLGSTETLPDSAHRIVTRTLLGTGTAGPWASTSPLPFLPTGDNQPTSLPNSAAVLGSDVVIADLGLGIHHDEVDFASFEEVSDATVGGTRLEFCTAAFVGPVKSQDLLGSLMQGRGWCMSWRWLPGEVRPRFGAVDFYAVPSASELEYTDPVTSATDYLHITDTDLGGANWMRSIPKVDMAWRAPVDTFEVDAREHLVEGGARHSSTFPSVDKGAWRRQGAVNWNITDLTLSDPSLYDSNDDRNWRPAFMARFGQTIAPFMALPNRVVKLPVASWKGRHLGPGQAFALTSSLVNSLDGLSLGVSVVPCRVISQDYNPNTGLHMIEAVMYGVDTTSGASTVWGGMVRGRSTTNPSGDNYVITVEQDWCDAGHGSSDSELAFTDPGYIPDTTNPVADILESFNGVDWFYSGQGTVTATTSTTVSVTMLSSASLYADTYKILTLAPTDDQSGWAATIGKVAYVCTTTGTTTGTGSTGGKLQ